MNPNVKACKLLALALSLLFGGLATADETDLIWSTFLGGSAGQNPCQFEGVDCGYGIAVDDSGYVYVTGYTRSDDFPITAGAFDSTHSPCRPPSIPPLASSDVFVTKFNSTGSTLVYSTFLGGNYPDEDIGHGIAVDDSGYAHVTGQTGSGDFPTTAAAFDTTLNGGNDAFVVKLNRTGSALKYSTFLGGSGTDYGHGIVLDGLGYAYLTGYTTSTDFPTSATADDTTYNGNHDVFVAKLNPTGSTLVYSTFLGGSNSDYGRAIALDSSGHTYVTGETRSTDFPTTAGAFDGTYTGGYYDAFVSKLNPEASVLEYSTFLGGSDEEYGYGIVVDDSGKAYLSGYTSSTNFPTTAGAFDITHNGSWDVFVTKLSSTGSALEYATFLGGNTHDCGYDIALNSSGSAYLTGYTYSTDFPTTAGAFDRTYNGGYKDAFVAKLNPTGSALDYSTFLGGNGSDHGYAITLDDSGHAHLTGETYSADFPTTVGAFDTTHNGNYDVFVAKLIIYEDTTSPEGIDDLAIELENLTKGGDIRLRWTEPYDDMGVTRYVVYRSTVACSLGDSLASTTDTTHLDTGAIGDVDTNYCYAVKAADAVGNKSEESNQVGEYDFALKTTTGTDYTWVAFCLGDTSIKMASDLEAYIESHSSPATNCLTISEWNPTAQTYTHYTTIPIPMGDFALQPGRAYRVEVITDAVWTLVGDVLAADSLSFDLKTTTGTDYTWISLPMNLDSLVMASDLEAHIEGHSNPATDCLTISEWNPTAQTYTHYTTIPIPMGDFTICPGRAYRVEVTGDAVWPQTTKSTRQFQRALRTR